VYDSVHKLWQETDYICRSYIKKSNGLKFADPSMADDRPLFHRGEWDARFNRRPLNPVKNIAR